MYKNYYTAEHTCKPAFKQQMLHDEFSSLHAVLQSQKDTTEQGKAERRTRMIKGTKWVLIKELNRHGFSSLEDKQSR